MSDGYVFNPNNWVSDTVTGLDPVTVDQLDDRYVNIGENVFSSEIENLQARNINIGSGGRMYFADTSSILLYINNFGNTNLLLFITGRRKKNNPEIINNTPTYCKGLSNLSPKNIIADADSINALNPFHAAFTIKTFEPCKQRIK
jgi:hypothetical protein